MTTHITVDSIEIEMTILGSIINSPENLKVIDGILDVEDFFHSKHRAIFQSIKEAHKSKGCLDVTILSETLKNNGYLESIGGIIYLIDLCQFAGTSSHVEAYCEDLRALSVKRSLLDINNGLARDLKNGIAPHKALERLGVKVRDLKANKPHAESAYRHLLEKTTERNIIEEVKNISPGARVGFRVGEIDLKIPGGALSIVAGPTGHGKTLLLINFILNYLKLNPEKQAHFFSYEESRSSILSLFLNTFINTELASNNRESIKSYFRDGQPTYILEEKRAEFLRLKEEFFKTLIETNRLNIFYSDYSAEELKQAISFLKKTTPTGLIGIDYMQLLSLLNKKNTQRQEELKQICRMLKDCAVDTGLPILLAAQFNRTVVNEATISPVAIGEAGDIERAANMIIGLWNRNYEGFTADGNKTKNGKIAPKESAMYLEIIKGRETGIGHSSVFNLDGNTGALTQQTYEKF